MHILPYRGPERTFISPLRLEECVRRLQDDVEPSIFNDMSRWAQLVADPAIMRHVNGTAFSLYKLPRPIRGVLWTFDGTLSSHGDHTRIRGRYHLQYAYQAFLLVAFVLVLILAGYAMRDALHDGFTLRDLLSDNMVFILFPFILIAVLIWRNTVEYGNEIYLAEFIARFFHTHKHRTVDQE